MKTPQITSVLLLALALAACGEPAATNTDATAENSAWRVHGKVIEFTPSPYD